jgi:hypothetical protein
MNTIFNYRFNNINQRMNKLLITNKLGKQNGKHTIKSVS